MQQHQRKCPSPRGCHASSLWTSWGRANRVFPGLIFLGIFCYLPHGNFKSGDASRIPLIPLKDLFGASVFVSFEGGFEGCFGWKQQPPKTLQNPYHPKHLSKHLFGTLVLQTSVFKCIQHKWIKIRSFFDISQVKIQYFYIYFEFTVHLGAWEPKLCARFVSHKYK
jgi:hypothetical protein